MHRMALYRAPTFVSVVYISDARDTIVNAQLGRPPLQSSEVSMASNWQGIMYM